MAMTFSLYSTLPSSGNRVSYENFCVYYQTVLITFSHPIHLARSTGTGLSTTLNSHSSLSSRIWEAALSLFCIAFPFFSLRYEFKYAFAVLEGDPPLT